MNQLVRKNNKYMPKEFLQNKVIEWKSSIFVFTLKETLISYVSKMKIFILLLTLHQTNVFCSDKNNKPKIILLLLLNKNHVLTF